MRERASKEVEGIPEDDTQGGPLAYTHTHIHEHAHTHKRERGGLKHSGTVENRGHSSPCLAES